MLNQVSADVQIVPENSSMQCSLILAVLIDICPALQDIPDNIASPTVNCEDQWRVTLRHIHGHEVLGRERLHYFLDGIQVAVLDEVLKHADFAADWKQKDALEPVLAGIVVDRHEQGADKQTFGEVVDIVGQV